MFHFIQKIKPIKILYLVLFFELINITYYFLFFKANHYLPTPFIMDKNDTFMDFYNPLYWVIKDGFYNAFNSVYPALNYFILKLFSLGIDPAEVFNAFQLRNDNPKLTVFMLLLYIAIIYMTVNLGEWKKFSTSSRFLVFIACIFSVPVLFALERGNLIFFGLLFLSLYLNAKGEIAKSFYLALLINVKPYFLILLIQYFNKNQINRRVVIYTGLFSTMIFFILGAMVGMNFVNFFKAYFIFSQSSTISAEGIFSLPHSLAALTKIQPFIGKMSIFGYSSHFTFWFSFLKVLNYLTVLLLICVCFLNKLSSKELLISAIIILTNFSISTSGYILLIYIPLLAYLIDDPKYKIMVFCIAAIFVLSVDWVAILQAHISESLSYLGNNLKLDNHEYYFGLGSIVRPCLNYFIMVLMIKLLSKKYVSFHKLKHV